MKTEATEKQKCIGKYIASLITAVLLTAAFFCMPSYGADIEYDNLENLLRAGNSALTDSSFQTGLENSEYQIAIFEEEYHELKLMYQDAKDAGDSDNAKIYQSYMKSISATLKNLKRSYQKNYAETSPSGRSFNKQAETLVQSTQAQMNSYNRMLLNAEAAAKAAEAARAKYSQMTNRYSVGAANEADVNAAYIDMLGKDIAKINYEEQVLALRQNLLKTLGIPDDGTVTIGKIPDPDPAAVSAIDHDADLQQYISYSSDVSSARTLKITNRYKEDEMELAMGDAVSEFEDLYQQLMAQLTSYYSSAQEYDAACRKWESAQRKAAAGMLTETDRLSAEAEYLSASAKYQTGRMQLKQSYEDYQWRLIVIGGGQSPSGRQ